MNITGICFAVMLCFLFFSCRLLNGMKKHDTVLFMFCELRREIMQYLRENFDGISKAEAKNCLAILDCVNSEIHFFSRNKREVYNILNLIDNIRRSTVMVKRINFSEPSPALGDFVKKFNAIRFEAFRTFSPLYALLFRFVYHSVCLFFVMLLLKATVMLQRKEIEPQKLKKHVKAIGEAYAAV